MHRSHSSASVYRWSFNQYHWSKPYDLKPRLHAADYVAQVTEFGSPNSQRVSISGQNWKSDQLKFQESLNTPLPDPCSGHCGLRRLRWESCCKQSLSFESQEKDNCNFETKNMKITVQSLKHPFFNLDLHQLRAYCPQSIRAPLQPTIIGTCSQSLGVWAVHFCALL